MYLSLTILPLLGSIVAGFFGRKVGVKGAQLITILAVITTTGFAINGFFEVGFNNTPVLINIFRWIESEWFNIVWGFLFDSLTVSMLIPVLIISSLVHLYSVSYMSADPHNQRFFSYLSLFTFMMLILVTANNYLLMFVGWEGVGVCSYLLVSFWFTRIAANQSSISAFLTNRVGDAFLTIGMFAILWTLGNLDYATVFSLAPYINENIVTIIGICLLIGAMAKSSQVGLHVWLPMAMEGPTPVSALIHAATMVTAGVYLLIRSSPLIEYSSTVLLLCLWLGAITTVFSSLIGLFQQDIKKVIAYSTMSQLGMMVIAIGLSSYNLALFHLVNHAFYKGLLFLGAGAVIHAVGDNQDFRRYGGLISYLPLTYSVMLIASLSLVAFPFMTGFYSKDFILESAFGQYSFSGIAVYVIAVIGAIFTTLYSVKVLYLTFLTSPNGPNKFYDIIYYVRGTADSYLAKRNLVAHEGNIFLSLPLVVLAIFSIFFGYITKDIFIGLGTSFFIDNSIFIHPGNEITIDTEFAVPTLFKLLPLIFTISFTVIAIVISEFLGENLISFKFSRFGYIIFGFFNQRFLIELFYNNYITNLVLTLGGQTTKVLDKGSVEYVGPYGLEITLQNFSKVLTKLNGTVIPNYALAILVGFIFYIATINIDINIIFIIITGILFFIYLQNNNKYNTKSSNADNILVSSLFYINNLYSDKVQNKRFYSSSSDNSDSDSDTNNLGEASIKAEDSEELLQENPAESSEVEKNEASKEDDSKSPVKDESKSPAKDESKSPVEDDNKSPVEDDSKSGVQEESPVKEESVKEESVKEESVKEESPVQAESPVQEESPVQGESPVQAESPEEDDNVYEESYDSDSTDMFTDHDELVDRYKDNPEGLKSYREEAQKNIDKKRDEDLEANVPLPGDSTYTFLDRDNMIEETHKHESNRLQQRCEVVEETIDRIGTDKVNPEAKTDVDGQAEATNAESLNEASKRKRDSSSDIEEENPAKIIKTSKDDNDGDEEDSKRKRDSSSDIEEENPAKKIKISKDDNDGDGEDSGSAAGGRGSGSSNTGGDNGPDMPESASSKVISYLVLYISGAMSTFSEVIGNLF